MAEIKAIIFDLDGVLTNTSEYHYRAWRQLADELSVPFDRQRNEALRGVSRRRSLELLLDGRTAAEEQMQEWMARKNCTYVQRQRPAPDLFLHCARQLGVDPREAIVVEDAASGVEAALAGGFWVVGLGPRSGWARPTSSSPAWRASTCRTSWRRCAELPGNRRRTVLGQWMSSHLGGVMQESRA